MKKITKSIAVLLLSFPFASMAQRGANNYDRINVSGFNHDVIADGNVNA